MKKEEREIRKKEQKLSRIIFNHYQLNLKSLSSQIKQEKDGCN